VWFEYACLLSYQKGRWGAPLPHNFLTSFPTAQPYARYALSFGSDFGGLDMLWIKIPARIVILVATAVLVLCGWKGFTLPS
jgi:hypothetical protein